MIRKPIYDKEIIVGVIFNNTFNWYITDKFFWIMDLKKLSKIDYDNYFSNNELKKVRNGIIVLSKENAELFLDNIKEYKADVNILRLNILNEITKKNEEDELEEYYPSLMIDFDKNILYSQYPEPLGFENYVPDNWEGKYISFIDNIENKNKYWIYKNKNLLS